MHEKLQKAVSDLDRQIADAYQRATSCVKKINKLSPEDVRGKTPDISDRIRQLDKERREAIEEARSLVGERSALLSAASFVGRKKGDKGKAVSALARLSTILSDSEEADD